MPYREKAVEKLYWSIGEVGEELGVNASLIRFWEKQFGTIKPKRTGKGDRLYTRKEIDQLKRIQHLVKEKGYTLNGAKEQLRKLDEPETPEVRVDTQELRQRLLVRRVGLDPRDAGGHGRLADVGDRDLVGRQRTGEIGGDDAALRASAQHEDLHAGPPQRSRHAAQTVLE